MHGPRDRDGERPWARALFALGCATLGCACVELPEPPQVDDLSELAAQYDNPDGNLPDDITQELLERAQPYLDIARRLDGLSLIHTAVADTSDALDEALAFNGVTIQGVINAELACPGHGDTDPDDAERNGTIDVTMGVEDTRIQRAFVGSANDCQFVSGRSDIADEITFSAEFVADLGAPVPIGREPSNLLTIRLSDLDVSGDDRGSDDLPIPDEGYDFRVTADQAIEVLIDGESFGVRGLESVVLISHLDGSIGLRERGGEWRCETGERCTFSRSR